jgi:monofunctional biosynthetic peptidoglycan transglycosylase
LDQRNKRAKWVRRLLAGLLILTVALPVFLLLIFRFVPVPGTPEMLVSALGDRGANYVWVGSGRISSALRQAVIGSEDEKFCFHHGFDWSSINSAWRAHEEGARLRGASTISQQTARSLFLLPLRSWIRKGLEAYLTVLEEALWPKQRILTVYLNIVDWGNGNFGAEAAAEAYFHRSATILTPKEAARLAAILPDPDDWRAAHPGPYVVQRTRVILSRMNAVRRDGLESCLKH